MANSKLKCKHCKTYLPADQTVKHPAGRFCRGTDCVMEFVKASQERAREAQDRKARKANGDEAKSCSKAVRELNRRTLNWQHKQTQPRFNRMRVLQELKWFRDRGLEPTCISCGKPLGGDQWCCGHFKTRGAQSGLKYDPMNAYIQHIRRITTR